VGSAHSQPNADSSGELGWSDRPPGYTSLSEASRRTGLSSEWLRRLAKAGDLDSILVHVGRGTRTWLSEQQTSELARQRSHSGLSPEGTLGALLSRRRRELGLPQPQVAAQARITVGKLRRYEQGRLLAPRAVVMQVAAIVGIPEDVARKALSAEAGFSPRRREELCALLIRRRRQLGLTQPEAAELASITVGRLRRYEQGDLLPSRAELARIAAALGTAEYFVRAAWIESGGLGGSPPS
jgi:transcriptional regulator with XRE-family HTH domain